MEKFIGLFCLLLIINVFLDKLLYYVNMFLLRIFVGF